MSVTPFSVVNLYNGNLTTVIPLVSFDPVGPPVSFTLYHNSTAAASGETVQASLGFSFGPGWTCSYSSRLTFDFPPNARLIEDDGNLYNYTFSSSTPPFTYYTAEAGVFDRLVKDDNAASDRRYVLTRPDGTQRYFDSAGKLTYERDDTRDATNRNEIAIVRDTANSRVLIQSAAKMNGSVSDHPITINYSAGYATTMTCPRSMASTDMWTFVTESNGLGGLRTKEIRLPSLPDDPQIPLPEYKLVLGYDTSNRVLSVTDRDSKVYSCTYSADYLATVTDPAYGYTQSFTIGQQIGSNVQSTYTDRRGYVWKFLFSLSGNFTRRTNPLNKYVQMTYNSSRLVTSYMDERFKTWTTTYVSGTNRPATIKSPLPGTPQQIWTFSWQPVPGEPNVYRMTQVTDPLGHWTIYEYESDPSAIPLRPIRIREQAALSGGSDAVTSIEYHQTNRALGQIYLVTDANGVAHKFTYDEWGYFEKLIEGLDPANFGGGMVWPCVVGPNTNDPIGNPTGVCSGFGCSNPTGDPSGRTRSNKCLGIGRTPPTCPGYIESPKRLADPLLLPAAILSAKGGNSDFVYDPAGRLTDSRLTFDGWTGDQQRNRHIVYDDVGRPRSWELAGTYDGVDPGSNEFIGIYDAALNRRFEVPAVNGYDAAGHVTELWEPGGVVSQFAYDQIGRLTSASRNGMSATNTYDDAHRLTQVVFASGAKIVRTYDDANRLTRIEHKSPTNVVLYQLDYVWNLDNTIYTRAETDNLTTPTIVTTVTFTYDARKRLTREVRQRTQGGLTTNEFDIHYQYDQLGNRTYQSRLVGTTLYETNYVYDTDYPNPLVLPYPTRNNRLLSYTENTDGVPLRTVTYTYYQTGDASNITIRDVGDLDEQGRQIARDLALYYNKNGMLSLAYWGTWSESGGAPVAGMHTATTAREFRYDAARQRYAAIPLTRISGTPEQPCFGRGPLTEATWTDYVGDMPYTDFQASVNGGTPFTTTLTRHFLNSEQNGAGVSQYFHDDLLRSAVLATDSAGAPVSAGSGVAKLAYTAFGEEIALVGGNGVGSAAMPTRYRYVGGYGYEADWLVLDGKPGSAPITLQHVGYRWYQANIGRFVQRDPAGLAAGLNQYVYCRSRPASLVDPAGLGGKDPTYGLPKEFWNWAHHQVEFAAEKVAGNLPKDVAFEWYQEWLELGKPMVRGPKFPGGFVKGIGGGLCILGLLYNLAEPCGAGDIRPEIIEVLDPPPDYVIVGFPM
ncbi:MAG: RHS repeat-associated core domain-containing protein [Phycisphaerae bacterium]